MDIAEAFQLVLELAKETALRDLDEARESPELALELKRHWEALDMVEDYVVNQLGDD